MKVVKVPSGIGDVSWMYSKLCHVDPLDWQIADGWPYRTKHFLELLPKVRSAEYGNFIYTDIITSEEMIGVHGKSWEELSRFEELLLEANTHLESGKRLEDWLPDLPTDFHYSIRTSPRDVKRAEALLGDFPKPLWGVSAASYRGSEAWKTWGFSEWRSFLEWFKAYAGGTIILMGGFWDDLTDALASEGYDNVVGRTSFGAAVEMLRRLDGYVGFSSGLGIVGTVLDRKVFMMWPEHQQPLSRSWAPPEMLESGRYAASRWGSVEEVSRLVRKWLGT
jgi:hypothetical protein